MPLDDTAAYELLARGDTVGVFQVEGAGVRDMLRKLRPDRFEDIIAANALYRPGQTAPEKPPKDYLTYLRGLSRQGATLADEKKITVDGHSATLMTGTTEQDLDGSIGGGTGI